ncbi:hypothetical protein RJT34_30143 [Clitoria ternatea]|uniref:Uncharacterized protein n=1 Tax=Clitoria ternatea TaxID=43366 RepID=A0AAN9I2D4_CLITE
MGRGRGKSKKLSVKNEEDHASGEDEKVPMQKRRGRPQKVVKDEFDEEEIEKIEEYESGGNNVKEMKNIPNTTRHGRKRKGNNLEKKMELVDEEKNGVEELSKCNGFNGRNRRKSKPRRAAEAGVLCKQDYVVD